MSTRWQIVAKLNDGNYGCIYVHCDGYPEYALRTLRKNYNDQDKIEQLIGLGDCLSIESTIAKCETFHGRDEDWDTVKPDYAPTAKEAGDKHHHGDEECGYVWDGVSWEQITPER